LDHQGFNEVRQRWAATGQLGEAICARDWGATSLGKIKDWRPELKTLVGLMLNSRQPMFIAWGPDHIWLYNDAFIPIAGRKHPDCLGLPAAQVWSEAWSDLQPLFDQVRAGCPVHMDDISLQLDRNGKLEEAHFAFSYTPTELDDGSVAGLFGVCIETTDHVLANRNMASERERLARLFEQAPTFMAMLHGPEHRIDLANPRYLELIGNRPVLGKTMAEALPEAVEQGYLELLDSVFQSGKAYSATGSKYAVRSSPDGPAKERYVDFVYQPVLDADGHVSGIFVEGYDVTEHVAANEAIRVGEFALRSSSERLRLATEAAQIGTWDFYPGTGSLNWDSRCKALFGLPPNAEVNYDTFLAGLHPDDRESIDRANQQALDPDGSGYYNVEYRTIGIEDGIERWIAATGRARFEDRKPVRYIGTVMDVSVQKKAEGLLRESEAKFLSFAQAMPNHVWSATPDGQLNWFNEQVFRFTGLPFSELEGERWTAVVHPNDLQATATRWSESLNSGKVYETEFRLRRADGVYRWHVARAVAISDDAGRITCWVGTNTDINDQKELNEILEQRVQERTGQLQQTEEALRQAQKMEAVGQLTGGIAHDFNNLLQGITGALDRIQHRIAEGRVQEVDRFLKAALESANRAASLTHRLLAFSRRQTLDPHALDVNRLIAGMDDLIRRSVGPTVKVEVVGAGGLWPIWADVSQLENSLLNLCINARDAMPDGGNLTIETANKWLDTRAAGEREIPPGQYVTLSVTDSGTGMAPEVIARAFDPFFTTKPLGKGTGLGLSMIYGFVRQSGGQVRIYSEQGQGTTMCLYFPRHLGAVEDGPSDVSEVMERGFGETVLVVDDEPTVRMLITEVLSESYYRILEAGDGLAALKVLETNQRIDLMITDVGLPGGLNGRQVADAARVLRTDLKVLFITGYAENAVVGNGHLDPGMEILAKPFAMSTLANKVREMIER
jgi:PAS domain S-box-containing protein